MSSSLPTIAVFAYDFPHRKTQSFLSTLFLENHDINVVVIAAPYKKLKTATVTFPHRSKILASKQFETSHLCKKYGFHYYSVDHHDQQAIENIVKSHSISTAYIAGARIIKSEIIDLFPHGVVNFHPGPLPETAGLDSLYYVIKNKSYMGITAHYIDARVDAGDLIDFFQLEVRPDDTLTVIAENLFVLQCDAFSKLLSRGLRYDCVSIDRPFKNKPMIYAEKEDVVNAFEGWKKSRLKEQLLMQKLEQGDLEYIRDNISASNVNRPLNKLGWTPLTIACFCQHIEVVRYLLSIGANVNVSTLKGTTPLMYAKTKLVGRQNGYELLDLLIESGADIMQRDFIGNDISFYIEKAGDMKMLAYLKEKTKCSS